MVAEALACGVPVITTRVGLAAELVRDGENGFLCDWNAADVGQRLAQIVSDDSLRSRLSENAPRAVERFEKKRVIKEYAEGYQRLIRDTQHVLPIASSKMSCFTSLTKLIRTTHSLATLSDGSMVLPNEWSQLT